ncbi:MAG: hypothetical protein QXP77_02140 [Candidatus Aenigmatarchaeota archaeon]
MIRSYEAIIAITIISISFVLFFKDYENYEIQDDKAKIFNVLKGMDLEGKLRSYTLANNSEEIERELSYRLPEYDFLVEICELECEKPNVTQEFFSITYLVSGYFDNFNPRQIIVYVMR